MFPTRSLASTIAPWRPVYVHFDLLGNATYSLATATAWILFVCLGTVRLTVSLSSSLRIEGIVGVVAVSVYVGSEEGKRPLGGALLTRGLRCRSEFDKPVVAGVLLMR